MRYSLPFLLFLFMGASAFPQGIGTIQCDPGSAVPVPAFSAPGKPHVVAQLKCGQTVRILGIEKSHTALEYSMGPQKYVTIQIADQAAYVDARLVKFSESEEPLKSKIADSPASGKRVIAPEEEEQKKWSVIAKDSISFREERLLQPITLNGQTYTRTFRAIVSNNSDFPVSQIQLLVRVYDCSARKAGLRSNCDIVGESKIIATTSIPPHQTRRVEAVSTFESIPPARSTISWNYKMVGVRAE